MASINDDYIAQLCKTIIELIDSENELKTSLDKLSNICSTNCTESNSEELLLCVLRTPKFMEVLKYKPDLCVKTVTSFLNFPDVKDWPMVVFLIKLILQSDFKNKDTFLADLWSKKELYMMPANLVLMLAHHGSHLIDEELCNLYITREHKGDEDIWKTGNFQNWISWCSKNSELFLIVTSILNQIVIHAKAKFDILKITSSFIENVMIECERNKTIFFSLYPIEYQSFVAALIVKPYVNPCKKEVLKKIKLLNKTDKTLTLLFLSHFPTWLDVVKV